MDNALGIAVFAKGTRTSGLPQTYVSYEQAQEWAVAGVARWVNRRRKSIIMLVEVALHKIRGESCVMAPHVVEAAIDGSKRHQEIVKSWR